MEFIDQISKIANTDNINVFPREGEESEYTLYQAFRTFGSREHLDWIDHFLGYERAEDINGRLADGYDIQVVTTPDDLLYMVHDKVDNGERARVLAGLCWNWKDEYKNDNTKADIKIVEGGKDYTYSWNRYDVKNWTVDKGTIDEIGCVHTVLGQEFDYAGVIIGDDLTFDGQHVVPNSDKNTQFMRYDNDSKRVNGMPINAEARADVTVLSKNKDAKYFEEAKGLVRNHYHILLTRGRKGCYIYCTDPALREYLCKLLNQDKTNTYDKHYDFQKAKWEDDRIAQNANTGTVMGNSFNYSYHRPDCQYAPKNPQKRVEFSSLEKAKEAGYRPCRNCNP